MKQEKSKSNSYLVIAIAAGLLCSCHGKSKGLSVAPYNETDTSYHENTVTNTTTMPADSNLKTNTTGTMTDTATHTGRTGKMGAHKGVVHTTVPAAAKAGTKMQPDAQGYYNYTQTAPSYPGGQQALEEYVSKNVEYPEDALDKNIEGTVLVKFTIDDNGKVGNIQTEGAPLGYGLEDAAKKIVNRMPLWTPGTVNGKKVKGWYTLPVTFKIEE